MRKQELEKVSEDKIELVKQAEIKETITLEGRILPKRNHTLFECSIVEKTVCKAKYEDIEKTISFEEATKQKEKLVLGKPNFKTKGKVIIQKNCLYISALNFKNVVKILERDYNLVWFKYLKD
jgi:acyl-[acyl carrier protein]--UDP-N-acetylglucosamine O-acyltransferase